jgi:hypothetical protein
MSGRGQETKRNFDLRRVCKKISVSLFCLGGVFQSFKSARFGGVVVQQIWPRYDAASSLAGAASLVKACIDIIAKALQYDSARAATSRKCWDAFGRRRSL